MLEQKKTLLNSHKGVMNRLGQATTEYVVLLAVLVVIFLSVASAFTNRLKSFIEGPIGSYIERQFFNANSMHQLPLRIPK